MTGFVLTIKESSCGFWCICSGSTMLYDRLNLARAIRLARGLAREEHANSGEATRVDMTCEEFTIVLAQEVASGPFTRARAA